MEIESFVERGPTAEVVVRGVVTLEELAGMYRRVFAECSRRQIGAVLVDLSGAEGTLEATERATLVEMLSRELDRGVVLASVLNGSQFLPTRLGQLMAQNRGFRVREFTDREEASAWILSTLAPPPPDTGDDLL